MFITNVVYSAHLSTSFDLRQLCHQLNNARYQPQRFPGLLWHHRKIGGNCTIFSNGIINCNGKALSLQEGKQRLRRYARKLQKLGYCIHLKDVKLITASACHTLSGPLDLICLASERNVNYEPELFSCLNFKTEGINFGCFHTGKVIVTGVKSLEQIHDVVYPTLIELELYTRKNE